MNDFERVALLVGIRQLMGTEKIFLLRTEIEAILRLSQFPESFPCKIDWPSVKERLRVASNETSENRKAMLEMGILNYDQ